jgi:hypothetical protein
LKFSNQLKIYKQREKETLDFIHKTGYSIEGVTEFSLYSSVPVYLVYYYAWQELNEEDAEKQMRRLLKFYGIDYDLR